MPDSLADLGPLPEWDLSDLYDGPEDPALEADLTAAGVVADRLAGRWTGRLSEIAAADLAVVIAEYEGFQEALGRAASYAGLLRSRDVADPEIGRFNQTVQERVTDLSAKVLFVELELNQIDDAQMERLLTDPALAHHGPWLRDLRARRPFQLREDLERLLHEKRVVGSGAWSRLFDETMARLRFDVDGESLTATETLHRLSGPDAAQRARAASALAETLGREGDTFALITNTLAKDKAIEDGWRGFERPISGRNLANLVEDEVVEALIGAVRSAYPRLSHRYYRLKARWFGVERLPFWDRNAPLPEAGDERIAWSEARDTVLGAYRAFSPDLAEIGGRFFDQGWIDAPVVPGKAPGAFSHPTVPSAHPYILVNYQGRSRDVMTLAHELGHGVHQVLAGGQGYLLANTPLTLAETASVFGEMLTFQALLERAPDQAARKRLLASKVEDMLNTVVRQIAMCEFERRVHDERRGGEMTAARLDAIWLETQSESLGPAIDLEGGYQHFWSYIPHFIHVPFYVYAYAFGDCLVNSLYAAYRAAPDGFAERYIALLSAGGRERHGALLAPFGLDASDPGFWNQGLRVIEDMIDDLERMS